MPARGFSFRFHFSLGISFCLLLFAALLALGFVFGILPLLNKHTETEITSQINRVQIAFSRELESLSTQLIPYSFSDATRQFVSDRNLRYLADTFSYEAYERLGVNIIAIFDTNGKVVYAEQYQLDTKRPVTLFTSFAAQFAPGKSFVAHQSESSVIAGLLQLPETTLLVATRPIVTSDGRGPVAGTIVFARYLDPLSLKRISDLTGVAVELRSVLASDLPPDYLEAKQQFSSTLDVVTKRPNVATVNGFTQLTDIDHRPVLILKTSMPNTIELAVKEPIIILFSVAFPMGLVLALITSEMLLWKVKKSLSKLTRTVKALADSEGSTVSLTNVSIAPDLAILGHSIENLKIRLQEQQQRNPMSQALVSSEQNAPEVKEISESLAQATESIHMLEKQLEAEKEQSKKVRMVGTIPLEELQQPIQVVHDQIHALLTQYGVLLTDLGLKQMIHDIYDNSKKLIDRIEQASDVAKHHLAKMNFKIERFDLIALSRELRDDLSLGAALKQVELVIDTRGFVQLPITADRERVRQVIEQLVNNAIKFTDTGSIRIAFVPKDGMVSFSVSDTGKGLHTDIVKKLNTLFTSGEVTHDQTLPGQTGVGLIMVKLLLDRMGGTIVVEQSELGIGTTFVVTLPVSLKSP